MGGQEGPSVRVLWAIAKPETGADSRVDFFAQDRLPLAGFQQLRQPAFVPIPTYLDKFACTWWCHPRSFLVLSNPDIRCRNGLVLFGAFAHFQVCSGCVDVRRRWCCRKTCAAYSQSSSRAQTLER